MMKILEVVMGSNHRFIQPQTVGKKTGAPMIWKVDVSHRALGRLEITLQRAAYKYSVQSFWIMSGGQGACILHVAS